MAADSRDGDGNFLRRWSQRKLAAAREPGASAPPAPAPPVAAVPSSAASVADGRPANAPVAANATAAASVREETPALPPVDSLTFDSDFTAFLSPKVDETMKRQALRKLFGDPRFNVMDGLDVYIDDYSKFEPIPDDLIGKLAHARYVFDPPRTRVNDAGHVEDVLDPTPAEAASVDGDADASAATAAPEHVGSPSSEAPPEAAPGVIPETVPGAAPEVGQSADARPGDIATVPAGDAGRVPRVPDVVERGKPR